MIKKLSKYFSLILILVLVNSNFSFAVQSLLCGMSTDPKICECKHQSPSNCKEISITKEKSSCCTFNLKEINNSTTFEVLKRSSLEKDIVILIHNLIQTDLNSNFVFHDRGFTTHPKTFTDIPILTSQFLI
ncbi:MAG: hypothetical protein ABIY50_00050 [Ignavibacteria bacterium]